MRWTEMIPAQFDKSQVKDRKAREFIETAGATMFPDLLPEIQSQPPASLTEPMPGEVPMFGPGSE
jgi:hypothetical protein